MKGELLRLKLGEIEVGKIALNSEDAHRLGMRGGEFCLITFPVTMKDSAAELLLDDNIPNGTFLASRNLTFQLGIEEDFECEIRQMTKPLKKVGMVTITIDATGEKETDLAKYVTDESEKIIAFLKGKIIRKNLSLINPDLGISIDIQETRPPLAVDEFALFDDIPNVKIAQKYESYFNGILLIDASSSMLSENPSEMMNSIENVEFLKKLQRAGGQIEEYIGRFIMGKDRIRRFDSAVLAVLTFLSVKVAKGRGEKMSIVLYSDEAMPIRFVVGDQTRSWISGSGGGAWEKETVSEILVNELLGRVENMDSAQTNIEAALKEAKEIADEMSRFERRDPSTRQDIHGNPITNPVMIVLLTDGRRTVGRAPVSVARELFSERPRTLLHTIGLGSDVEEAELIEMAKLCNGKYFNTSDAQELLKFYDKEATDFASVRTKGSFEAIFETLGAMRKT